MMLKSLVVCLVCHLLISDLEPCNQMELSRSLQPGKLHSLWELPLGRSLLYFSLIRWNGLEEKRRMPSPSHAVLVLSLCNFLPQAFRCCVLAKLLQAYCG